MWEIFYEVWIHKKGEASAIEKIHLYKVPHYLIMADIWKSNLKEVLLTTSM